jgi:putative membrane protein
MDYNLLKALHIIFVVTWFAGLFYIVRLFVYITETGEKSATEQSVLLPQLRLMAKRLWLGITWPSAIITLGLGTALLLTQPAWLQLPFMHVKLTFVFFLFVYQLICHRLYIQMQTRTNVWSSMKLRIWNELATLFLVAIVFLIVLKNTVDWLYGTLGLVIFAILLMAAIRLYKHFRK